jgi:hypothetical protein
MAHAEDDTLMTLYHNLRSQRIPRIRGSAVDLNEADVALFEEDGYLAGLVEQYQQEGVIRVTSIRLDRTIDARLGRVKPMDNRARRTLKDLLAYRTKMLAIASALSRVSGVRIEDAG